MDFDLTERQAHYRDRVRDFIATHIRPRTADYHKQIATGDRWQPVELIEELKPLAKAAGLWNLFMPPGHALRHLDETFVFEGTQLTNLEYALCAEEMGRIPWASEVFNCSAPDTGNMEVFHRYGTGVQKEQWLRPLMNGEIRSAFLMTEPAVASSDATNIQSEIRREGDEYVINGRKWWSSGAGDPRCKISILMGKTNPDNPRHQQQSMILMPLDAAGVTVERKEGRFTSDSGRHYAVLDLPGAYSLHAASLDEAITRDLCRGFLPGEPAPDVLVCVVDATNLRLHLRFALEVRELGRPMVVAVNMADVAQRRGITIDLEALQRELGVPVVGTVAVKRHGARALVERIERMAADPHPPRASASSSSSTASWSALASG